MRVMNDGMTLSMEGDIELRGSTHEIQTRSGDNKVFGCLLRMDRLCRSDDLRRRMWSSGCEFCLFMSVKVLR